MHDSRSDPGEILLKNFTAITLANADGGILRDVSIEIHGDKIAKVGRDLDDIPLGDYDRVIEGKGKAVIPGLVNAHTHAAMTLLRGYADDLPLMRWLEEGIWKAERKLTPEDVYWASLLAAIEMMRSGTTSFADMYFFMDEVAQAVEDSGMRALLAWGVVSPEVSPQATEPEKELGKAIDLVERWDGSAGGRIKTAFAPHSAYSCSEELLERIVRLAKEHDTRIHTHIAETRDELEEIHRTKGLSPVQFLDRLRLFEVPAVAAHCVHLSERDINILADRGVSAVHCPQSNMKLGSGIAPVPQLLGAGVNVALGTDGAASNNNLDMLEEMRFAEYIRGASGDGRGISPLELLKMATVCGAKALGLEKEIGTIEEGKRADLVILDLDRLSPLHPSNLIDVVAHSARPHDIEIVIIDGRIVMEQGKVSMIDDEEVKAKVKELSQKWRVE